MPIQFFLFSTITFVLALASRPLAADAATVFVEGPPGAEVRIDGESFGTLPWEGSQEVGEGVHQLRVRLRAHHDYELEFDVADPDDSNYVRAQLLPVDRNLAAASSLILAGLGQQQAGRKLWGWGFMAAQLTAATFAIVAEGQFKTHRQDFERAQSAYDAAISDTELSAQRALMNSAWSDMEDAESLRDLALYTTLGLAVVSAMEAWWTIGRWTVAPSVESDLLGPDPGVRLGIGGSF